MEVTPDKRQQARELADEFLGRGAAIARAAIRPLGVVGRLALIAGLVIWVAWPAPFWENEPHILFSLIALAFFAFPGVRLLRHRTRMQDVLENLPTLLDNVTSAMSMATGDLGDLRSSWRQSGESVRGGILGTGKRCLSFYRNDLAPLRQESKLMDQVNDALTAFGGPALMLSGLATVLAVVFLVFSPIAVLLRLIILAS
jgi:hypothetical protein